MVKKRAASDGTGDSSQKVRGKLDGDETEDCLGKIVKDGTPEAALAKGLINRFKLPALA